MYYTVHIMIIIKSSSVYRNSKFEGILFIVHCTCYINWKPSFLSLSKNKLELHSSLLSYTVKLRESKVKWMWRKSSFRYKVLKNHDEFCSWETLSWALRVVSCEYEKKSKCELNYFNWIVYCISSAIYLSQIPLRVRLKLRLRRSTP